MIASLMNKAERERKVRENVCVLSDICCVIPYDYKPDERGRKEREGREREIEECVTISNIDCLIVFD